MHLSTLLCNRHQSVIVVYIPQMNFLVLHVSFRPFSLELADHNA